MIGVLCREDELEAVREFFQLFKTPWGFYAEGSSYDAVIATRPVVPSIHPTLLIIYNSDATNLDASLGVDSTDIRSNVEVCYDGVDIPIYGNVAFFSPLGHNFLSDKTDAKSATATIDSPGQRVVRIGYNLFQEIYYLLRVGQPSKHASTPSLDIHIGILRECIVASGVTIIEIPPVPQDHRFMACLTHDVDFVGISKHLFDHTMWGFLYRATIGSIVELRERRISWTKLLRNARAALLLPLVYLGFIEDYWLEFRQYLEIENGRRSTFFLIPFKKQKGARVPGRNATMRATKYDVGDVKEWVDVLLKNGCEVGVHAIDSWHDITKARQELARITTFSKALKVGVRVHWLCFDDLSPKVLDQAGYNYDSTLGYNNVVGYRNGTTQVFAPLGTHHLLELPMMIQDGALMLRQHMGYSEDEAFDACTKMMLESSRIGGVLTVLWHMRSLSPERSWDGLYTRILHELESRGAWFATSLEVVEWYRSRRGIEFKSENLSNNQLRVTLASSDFSGKMGALLRVHVGRPTNEVPFTLHPTRHFDLPWNGEEEVVVTLP